jgi:transcriptional regulator GlxA family with amidase domain
VRSDEFDTVLAAGGPGVDAAPPDPQLLAFLRAAAAPGGARRVGSVCTGAFLLAEAGLLDGRRATTHWAYAARLAACHTTVRVEPDPLFLCDGGIWTSAGVTAGMDLALALVEEDAGRPLALAVARGLVLFLKRPGGQSQFSAGLAAQVAEEAGAPLRAVLAEIVAEPAADHRVDALAARAGMSPRSFARAFAAAVGVTPARFVERARWRPPSACWRTRRSPSSAWPSAPASPPPR